MPILGNHEYHLEIYAILLDLRFAPSRHNYFISVFLLRRFIESRRVCVFATEQVQRR
jgi:hypothetical protein